MGAGSRGAGLVCCSAPGGAFALRDAQAASCSGRLSRERSRPRARCPRDGALRQHALCRNGAQHGLCGRARQRTCHARSGKLCGAERRRLCGQPALRGGTHADPGVSAVGRRRDCRPRDDSPQRLARSRPSRPALHRRRTRRPALRLDRFAMQYLQAARGSKARSSA